MRYHLIDHSRGAEHDFENLDDLKEFLGELDAGIDDISLFKLQPVNVGKVWNYEFTDN